MRRMLGGLVASATALTVSLLLLMAAPVSADGGYPPGPGPTVVAQKVTPPAPAVQTKVAFTGSDILQWVFVGLAAILVGALLVVVARRRSRVGS